MALKTVVKISKVDNLSDARYCAGMGVDLVGFCLDPTNEDVVSPEKFSEITGWISGVRLVGEFYESSALVIKELIEKYPIDYIQVGNAEDLEYLSQLNHQLILNVDISQLDDPEQLRILMDENEKNVAYFLLTVNTAENEEELLKDFSVEINTLSGKFPILLGFGLNVSNVNSWIDDTSITGIALEGGKEIKPGYKDFDALADILEKIELDEDDM